MRDEMVRGEEILSLLRAGPRTIPEIVNALGYRGDDVVQWVMAMWKYGVIEEFGELDERGYYKYTLKE